MGIEMVRRCLINFVCDVFELMGSVGEGILVFGGIR